MRTALPIIAAFGAAALTVWAMPFNFLFAALAYAGVRKLLADDAERQSSVSALAAKEAIADHLANPEDVEGYHARLHAIAELDREEKALEEERARRYGS